MKKQIFVPLFVPIIGAIAGLGGLMVAIIAVLNLLFTKSYDDHEAIAELERIAQIPPDEIQAAHLSDVHFSVEVGGIDPSFFFAFHADASFVDHLRDRHQLSPEPSDSYSCNAIRRNGPWQLWWNPWMHPTTICYTGNSSSGLYYLLYDPSSHKVFLYIQDT